MTNSTTIKNSKLKIQSQQLLCIVGPTAVGKTSLAVKVSELIPSVLISADSRQLYKGMDIVTGKDHPPGVELFGLDLLEPGEDASVSLWYHMVTPVISSALSSNKLPIIVGGTGLYVKSLSGDLETISVPINTELRKELESCSIVDLQTMLRELDNKKYSSMNQSDANNPRRLVRAIEVANYNKENPSDQNELDVYNLAYIGLRLPTLDEYKQKIHTRVIERIEQGAIEETQELLDKYGSKPQSMTAIGYSHITDYLNNKTTKEEMFVSWVESELSYVKRQLTWFAKQDVTWLDPTSPKLLEKVEKLARGCYDGNSK